MNPDQNKYSLSFTMMMLTFIFLACHNQNRLSEDEIFEIKLQEKIAEMKISAMEECRTGIVADANLHVDTMMPLWYTEMIARDSLFPARPQRPQGESTDSVVSDSQLIRPLFTIPERQDSMRGNQ